MKYPITEAVLRNEYPETVDHIDRLLSTGWPQYSRKAAHRMRNGLAAVYAPRKPTFVLCEDNFPTSRNDASYPADCGSRFD